MPKQGKSPKKKTKEKSPQRTAESEDPEMDQDEFNRLFQNANEQFLVQLQQKHEEQITGKRLEAEHKVVEERLTTGSSFEGVCGLSEKGREGSNKSIYGYSFREEICCS